MSKFPLSLIPCLLGIAMALPPATAAEDAYVEGEVIVTFKANFGKTGADTVLGKHAMRMARHFDGVSGKQRRISGFVRDKSRTTAGLIAELKADSAVEIVEPNYIRRISAVPNDTHFTKLWGLRNTGQTVNFVSGTSGTDTRFLQAWALARPTGPEVVVGVVDTGVDITHPDLAVNIWVNPAEIAGNEIDDDGDGYVDDMNGYDFTGNTATITDSGYHGTHVAGTIAAVGKNGLGVIGVNYRAKILPMKVSSDGETMTTAAILSAYNYAVTLKQKGINIVALNASFGGGSPTVSEQNAIAALRDAGIILCVAAGNGGTDGVGDNNDTTPTYPASYTATNIISVAAIHQSNDLASFSNYGASSVDLAAPGVSIYSTEPLSLITKTSTVTVGGTTYTGQELQYSGSTNFSGLTKSIVACGLGNPADFPAGVSGNIALIQRGTLTFVQKVTNAMNAGAVAALIYDNTTDALTTGTWTLDNSRSWIPTLRITKANGEAILPQLTTTGTLVNGRDSSLAYQFLNGTSMATPHVTGAVAFAAYNFPSETVSQRIARILNHTTPVAALTSKMTTGGTLNLLGIIDTDADGLPDWWETDDFNSLAKTADGDDDGDGFSNLDEFLAGSDPLNASSHLAFSAYAPSPASGNFTLSFPSLEGRSYQIEWSDSLLSGSWSILGATLSGNGSTLQAVDAGALQSSSRRFYRIKVTAE